MCYDQQNKRIAVFLDRDGTLIEDRGNLRSPAEVIFFDSTFEALKKLQERFLLFIVSNQSGVAQGALTVEEVNQVNDYVVSQLGNAGIQITEVYWCPHKRSDFCECTKPNPFFLHRAATDYRLNLECSFMIGDHPHDVTFAENAGAQGIYVLTGHGYKHQNELRGDELVVQGIAEATAWIMRQCGEGNPKENLSVENIKESF